MKLFASYLGLILILFLVFITIFLVLKRIHKYYFPEPPPKEPEECKYKFEPSTIYMGDEGVVLRCMKCQSINLSEDKRSCKSCGAKKKSSIQANLYEDWESFTA